MTEKSSELGADSLSTAGAVELTATIVSAYVGKNAVQSEHLPTLIRDIHDTIAQLADGEAAPVELKPAVSIRKSITDDYLICLEDGLKFKSLKRHLRSKYDMTPDQYREKWGLPYDYPMVAPSYARKRSKLAKDMGLGRGK
ncbi:MAG: MucR family transcriptional regulator [Henriciella sp.]|nr:MucR family transcriptional regulator [Henriciella sp.]